MRKLLLTLTLAASLSAQAGITYDSGTGLLWQDNTNVTQDRFTYAQAEQFCASLKIGEYSDFRIPTMRELHTIVDYRYHDPAMLKGFKHVESEDFWTSTPYAYRNGDFWTIDFKKGTTEPTGERYSKNLRCVQTTN